jgi:sigma-B regulation protein RsbU (phosphoserine phosphatase)
VPSEISNPGRLAAVARTRLLDTDPEEPFDRLAQLAATLLDAPFAFVSIADGDRSFWKAAIGVGDQAEIERNVPIPESFCQYVIATGERMVVDDTVNDPRTRENPGIARMGVGAWAGFPLVAPTGDVVGSFCVVDTRTREWTEQDVHVLQILSAAAAGEVALRIALADERAARQQADLAHERSAALARSLQEALLPPEIPTVPGLEVAARYLPAAGGDEVVGDFFDLFQRGPSSCGFMIGDVAGKGVEAAKLATLARHTIRTAAMQVLTPQEILRTLNRAMREQEPDSERFVTAIYGTLDVGDRGVEVVLSVAGHPRPLVRRADGSVSGTTTRGTLLGALDDPILCDETLRLATGDALVLYTDGVIEARANGPLFGEQRLERLVATGPGGADALAAVIEGAVRSFSPQLADDTAILILRVPGAEGGGEG